MHFVKMPKTPTSTKADLTINMCVLHATYSTFRVDGAFRQAAIPFLPLPAPPLSDGCWQVSRRNKYSYFEAFKPVPSSVTISPQYNHLVYLY
jgi:hypothetical protein